MLRVCYPPSLDSWLPLACVLFALLLASGCRGASDSGEDKAETPTVTGAPHPEAPTPEPADAPPEVEPETGLAGPTSPQELAFGAKRPTAFGGAASTANGVLLAVRVEEGAARCPDTKLERCHVWYAVASGAPEPIRLAESDTPSGLRAAGVAPLGQAMAVLTHQGTYLGDETKLTLHIVDAAGSHRTVDVLAGLPASRVAGAALASTKDGALVCWASEPAAATHTSQAPASEGLLCRQVRTDGALAAVKQVAAPGRRDHAPTLAFRDGHGLLTWTREGMLVACPLTPALEVCTPQVLGTATTRGATIVAGHGGYLIAWQSPDGSLHGQRLERAGRPSAERLDLGALEVAPSGGLAAPQGFLLTANPDRGSRLLLVEPTGSKAHEVKQPADAGLRHWSAGGGLIEWRESERTITATWRPASSLLGPAAPRP